MKLPLRFILGLSLLVIPRASLAGLDLAWNSYASAGGAAGACLQCGSAKTPIQLVATLEVVGQSIPCFLGMDCTLDLEFTEESDVPAWWLFANEGCNPNGVTLGWDRSSLPDSGAVTTPWGSGGSEGAGLITFYQPSGNRARMLLGVYRSAGTVALAGDQAQFAFTLGFPRESAAGCSGCSTAVSINWASAKLYGQCGSDPVEEVMVSGPGRHQNLVRVNEGVMCPTAVRNRTWGAIKNLYR